MIRSFGSVAAVTLLAACAGRVPAPTPIPAAPSLARAIDTLIAKVPFDRTAWGILLVDAQTGDTLYGRNPRQHFIPASNTKMVVGAVALGTLGPGYRYRTPIYATTTPSDTLPSLLVVGSGDPSWSARIHGDVNVPLDSMAAIVAASGIRAARELIVDASLFTDEMVNPTWEVSDLPGIYAPPVAAFAIAEGTFQLEVSGGAAPGEPVRMRVLGPATQPVSLAATTDTAGARARFSADYTARRDTFYLSGSIGAGVVDTLTYAVTQPARSAGDALADATRRRGISIGGVRVITDSLEAAATRSVGRELGAYESVPLSRIVAVILQPSQNWTAEQVLKTLGARFGTGGSWRGGIEVERRWLVDVAGIDSLAFNLRDASGMAPQDLLAPDMIVALLDYARSQPWGAAYRSGMAQPGLEGSTLSNRLRELEGRLFAKTGTISNVATLSGYLVADDGREYLFSLLTNGTALPSGTVRTVMDEIMFAFARHIDAR